MTIKEMEERSGMTRANIRFYEAEGLLSPKRGGNGYRDYSEEDLDTLLRIKLLRTLHISIEEIKQVQTGERELSTVLDSQLDKLDEEQKGLSRSQEICREMRKDNVRFETLNAERYLEDLEREGSKPFIALTADRTPPHFVPWRRYFARWFDNALCCTIWYLFFLLVVHVNLTSSRQLFADIAGLVTMIFLEPVFLRFFKTTPGKWLVGIQVTDLWGRPLSYKKGLARTAGVFWRGLGLSLPIYNLVRLLESYRTYSHKETLPWEYDSELVVKDEKRWRCAALSGGYLLWTFFMFICLKVSMRPLHNGDLTVAEFCENYNRYAHYYDMDGYYCLDSEGCWVDNSDPGVYIIDLDMSGRAKFSFTEENGFVTGVTLEKELQGEGIYGLPFYSDEMVIATLSFANAQKHTDLFFPQISEATEQIQRYPLTNFTMSVYGVKLEAEHRAQGGTPSECPVMGEDGGAWSYSFRFTMTKED